MVDIIRPRLHRIEVPLPRSPLKAVNSYVLTSEDRTLVIDTGMRRPECELAFRAGLEEMEVDLATTDFFITHLHADHLGLVGELATDTSRVFFNRPDGELIESGIQDPGVWYEPVIDRARKGGFSMEEVEEALRRHPGLRFSPTSYPDFVYVDDGSELEIGDYRFVVVSTPGHTPGHMCLYEPGQKILMSGDHVLGDITPNITMWRENDDSLGDYFESLEKVARLDVDLVLPGHRTPIEDLRARIEELKKHHRHRLAEVMQILANRISTAYEVASKMTWDIVARSWEDFPVVQKWFAVSEATAHLFYLKRRGKIFVEERDGLLMWGGT
jgi:glyoxylase-like metal-dependent hydrolase (beta-lactamase superfamily II)